VIIVDLGGITLTLVAAAIAVVPAIVAFVRGRQIARVADDPALPERLAAGRNATSVSFAFTTAMLIIVTGRAAIWAIPVALIAYVAAGLPLRRVLYNETWSLAFYLSFVIRFFIAMWGFWLPLCALPALAWWAGDRSWIIALVMGAGLLFLGSRQTQVIRWVIYARPICDEPLRARFNRLAAACGLATPHFDVIDLKGGSVANAFALASLGRSAVVLTTPLLERLDADEIDAICAHELAHLEYYNPRRLRQRRLVSHLLIALGVAVTPLFQYLIPSLVWLACLAWPAVVLVTIAVLMQDQQKHETASDLRAAALTGNPEALVRALVKIHAIARMPRRWDADLERNMSHPSLKRRIQDIRTAVGTPPAMLGDAAVFESADGAARVVFLDETLEWNEGASASYRVRYERVSDLRIAATRPGETKLLAVDATGHRWQMPVRAEDVPRMQAVLDIVDARIVTIGQTPTMQPLLIRAATFTLFVVSLNAGLFAVAMIVAMALARPEIPLLGAAGVAAVAGALLTWRDPESMYGFIPGDFEAMFGLILLVGGAFLVWLAYAGRRDEVPPRAWKFVGVMAAAALASWILPLMGAGMDAIGFHRAAREWPSSIVLPLALAGALIWSARKPLWIASGIAAVASVMAASVGSQAFLDRFGGDLFLVPAPALKVRTLERAVKEFTVPFIVNALQISPSGRSIAMVTRQQDSRTMIQIGRAAEPLRPVHADGVLFIDDDRALVWTVDGSRTDLREVSVVAPEKRGWQLHITGVSFPAVSLDADAKRWRLASRVGTNVVEARDGVIGSDQINSYRWSMPDSRGSSFLPIAMAGDRALVLEPRPDLAPQITNPLGTLFFVLASAPRWRSTLWALGPGGANDLGTSRLDLECRALARAGGACHTFDASRTRFFALSAETRSITAVGSLPGKFFASQDSQSSWLTGWYQSSLIAVRTSAADAIRVAGPDSDYAHILAVSDRAAAGAWYQTPPTSGMRVAALDAMAGTSIIRIYPID
jgi:heat shock protein HtpX